MKILNDSYLFNVALKTLPTEGNLVYEYNPFYNYRLDHTMIYYKNRLMEISEFCLEVGVSEHDLDNFDGNNWRDFLKDKYDPTLSLPIIYLKGLLVNFETDQLEFSLNNPVSIIPQWSFDNSVNLIINDGKNPPRLINSRFSPTEKNKYLVCNRKGNNDSNIYDLGLQFDIDTSLYKKINNIPELKFVGVDYGGNLSVGNYHFYFKYVDEDGNESDFFAESGLVSIFIGNSADSIHSGFRNENSHKLVKFRLINTDSAYLKVVVYYTKATSDIFQNVTTSAHKVLQEFKLNDNGNSFIMITGFEETLEVSIDDINVFYLIYGTVETLTSALNMLFLGNVDKPKIPYEDLADCALRFLPVLDTSEEYNVNQLGPDYRGSIQNTYYDPQYIYNKVGYWDDEMYRLGVVFILADNTLTEVFNIRGGKIDKNTNEYSYTNVDFVEDANDIHSKRIYVNYDEQYYNIISTSNNTSHLKGIDLENAKGVILIDCPDFSTVIGLNFVIPKEVITYLQNVLNIKGFFFVRLKRIPTTLCLAYTIGIDKQSNTPVLPVIDENNEKVYITESFLTLPSSKLNRHPGAISTLNKLELENTKLLLDHDFNKHKYILENLLVRVQGALCPEYDVNSPYLNTLFSASELVCRDCKNDKAAYLKLDDIHFVPEQYEFEKANNYSNIKVIGVEDNTKLVAINDYMFSARAGEAEEAFRFEYIGKKNVTTDATNLLRGSYGPYLGITGYEYPGHLIDIKIPGYNLYDLQDYFIIRYNDKSPYFSITNRFDLSNKEDILIEDSDYYKLSKTVYRGDCYICQVTHRFNRNFLDPSSPTNDEIVDPNCWKDNFQISDGVLKVENFEKVNLGDVNAVQLGMYITLIVRSTINLNIRALDDSIPDEEALFGHPRGFYPYFPMTTKGSYKIPEALCYNKGFEKSVSDRYNFEVPDVPWIKNEFSNRIAYSNIQVQDAFLNGWRTFIGTHYKDYPKTYGSIIRLEEWFGDIIAVCEHGVLKIPVNERAIAAEGSGGLAYINTSNVLPENPIVLSDTFGSLWKESIIKTPLFIYGVDTVGKKVWRTDGKGFECISDFYILEFLNNNISLTERELDPIIGVRNVKSHYNKYKKDVMFTFYDNLHGFEEKVWNICFNEYINKWITFYSWLPSYSENIYNLYFSFDRNTSKWIAKLGISTSNSTFEDGVTVENPIITSDGWFSKLSLSNRNLPIGDGISYDISYELVRDNYNNFKLFRLEERGLDTYLIFEGNYLDIISEFYERDKEGKIVKDDRGRRVLLSKELLKNPDKIVRLLNIRAHIKVKYEGLNPTLGESYTLSYNNGVVTEGGYYESVIALIPKYNMLFLTTDFWKHGRAGIIDISESIYPTYWYGKQHPFEFEFIVADNPLCHKIFDNLLIISNKAAPESFHYEIVGECYDFAKDKKNMYIRQEATKELYLFNGSDITYNSDYKTLDSEPRMISGLITTKYDKSTIFPLYYVRLDTINEIEDYYHLYGHKDVYGNSDKNFSALSGAEIVRYPNLEEYRIWNHVKAVDIHDFEKGGRMRGNMLYKEDKWDIQINPINLVQKNEDLSDWTNVYGDSRKKMVPAECNLFNPPAEIYNKDKSRGTVTLPSDWERNIVSWGISDKMNKEVKLKDKFIKVRVRYSGKDLAVISALKTLYSISYA